MSKNPDQLPYFKAKEALGERGMANFLLRKFKPGIKRKTPRHYLTQSIPHNRLRWIKEESKRYPYFLRFDIRLYYPSIEHAVLLEKLPEIYQKITGKPISRRFKGYLKGEIPKFLSETPYGKGIPIGSRLSSVLAGIFLLDLDWEIKNPFLRQTDDYLIFCKQKKEPENLLRSIILPKLQELRLEINEKKLTSGRFHRDKVNFIGFDFYAGHFTIAEDKIKEFKKKITKLTSLTKKKPEGAVIKALNNKILGFGHYYKFADCKNAFKDLDAFTRFRLRRYILRNRNLFPKTGNLLLTNAVLKSLGLKSLSDIKGQFDRKSGKKSRKSTKNNSKSSHFRKQTDWHKLEQISEKHTQIQVLRQLTELTSLIKKLERRLASLERRLVVKNRL